MRSAGAGAPATGRDAALSRLGPPGRGGSTVLGHLALPLEEPPLLSVHAHVSGLLTESGSRAGGTRTPNRRFWRPVLCQIELLPSANHLRVGSFGPRIAPVRPERPEPERPASGLRPTSGSTFVPRTADTRDGGRRRLPGVGERRPAPAHPHQDAGRPGGRSGDGEPPDVRGPQHPVCSRRPRPGRPRRGPPGRPRWRPAGPTSRRRAGNGGGAGCAGRPLPRPGSAGTEPRAGSDARPWLGSPAARPGQRARPTWRQSAVRSRTISASPRIRALLGRIALQQLPEAPPGPVQPHLGGRFGDARARWRSTRAAGRRCRGGRSPGAGARAGSPGRRPPGPARPLPPSAARGRGRPGCRPSARRRPGSRCGSGPAWPAGWPSSWR